MLHLPKYSFRGTSRLAADSGLAKCTISRLVRGTTNPLYSTIGRIVKCLNRQLGRELPHDEVIAESGRYPTAFVCELVGCPGCLPDQAYHDDGSLRSSWRSKPSGQWTGDYSELFSTDQESTSKGGE